MAVGTESLRKRKPLARVPRKASTRAPGGSGKPAYTHLAATGLLLIGLAPALGLLAALWAGLDLEGDASFLVTSALVPLAGAALVWRYGIWAKAVGIVIGLAGALMLFWLAFGLAYPFSFVDFTLGAMLPLGVVVGVGGSIAALVAERRGNFGTGPGRGERRMITLVVGLIAAAAVVSGVWHLVARDSVSAEDAQVATMEDFAFTEATYTLPADLTVGVPLPEWLTLEQTRSLIVVRNSDPFVHDFAIPELGIDAVSVVPGGESLIEIVGAAPGTYTIYCTLHSDVSAADGGGADAMVAQLVVE